VTTPEPSRLANGPYSAFVDFVRRQTQDNGTRAHLRRSLRGGDTISADAWWTLGAWLPDNHDEALIMTRVAGWIAAHRSVISEPRRSIAGEIARPDHRGSPESERRLLEAVTRDGVSVAVRCDHITRALQSSSASKLVDWGQMISDLVGLSRGGEWAHSVRARWYREYHNQHRTPAPDKPETEEGRSQ
jgi:CRISPR type I-E-associated protein CasB/Cse2